MSITMSKLLREGMAAFQENINRDLSEIRKSTECMAKEWIKEAELMKKNQTEMMREMKNFIS